MSFSEFNLAEPILRAINECGYTTPTPIQSQSIPQIIVGRDVLASAQTGTGKTAAFMLPALAKLSEFKRGPSGAPRVLVLTPTRELAAQVTDATRKYGRYLRVKSAVILGGVPYGPQFRDLSAPIDLVVGTPGRLIDHLDRGSLKLDRVELLILDEADRMLDMGFRDAVDRIVAAAPKARQTLLFSATVDRETSALAGRLLTDPLRVAIASSQVSQTQIDQRLHVTDDLSHKKRLLYHFAADPDCGRTIVFTATKRDAEALAIELSGKGHRAASLHGDMGQSARTRAVRDLRDGRVRILVATDVAARGLDVNGISHVINFDLPQAAEDYIHRIGRTGRAGASGIAISFAGSRDDVQRLERIERFIGKRLPQTTIEGLEPTRPLSMESKRRPSNRNGNYGKPSDFSRRQDGGAKRSYGSRRPTSV